MADGVAGTLGTQEAQDLGDEYLALEKYVNLNYMVCALLSAAIRRQPQPQPRCLHAELSDLGSVALRKTHGEGAGLQGFHKILKKHDKMLPHAPCQQFYIAHLHQQKWVQVSAAAPPAHLEPAPGVVRPSGSQGPAAPLHPPPCAG